jgi:predicted RNA methylase
MADSDVTERARLVEQDALDGQSSAADRNRLGQYATPPDLAAEIAAVARAYWSVGEPVRFLEPCVGTGAFFSAVRSVFPSGAVSRAVGHELDPRFAAAAARLWGPAGLEVVAGDFTAARPSEPFNLILTNPPYVRHHHLTAADKRRLGDRAAAAAGVRPSGLAGLYVYFPLVADPWLAAGGLAAWLIPSEFLDMNYGAALKRYLTRNVDLLRVHRFCPADVQFADALVTSTVVFYRKRPPTGGSVAFTAGPSVLAPATTRPVDRADLRDADKWGRLFGPDDTAPRPAGGRTLGDLFAIRRGLATGGNDYFILPRAEAARLGLPPEFLRPILPGPRSVPGPVIEADPDGFPRLDPQLVLLDCRLNEAAVRGSHPQLWKYLEAGRQKGIDRGYLTSRRTPWYSQEDRPPPPFLCPYMGRPRGDRAPFRFLWNRSRATAPNVYMLLYPKGPLARRLADDPGCAGEVFDALGRIAPAEVTAGGRVYGGGLHKVEPNELAAVPADPLAELLGLPPEPAGLFG